MAYQNYLGMGPQKRRRGLGDTRPQQFTPFAGRQLGGQFGGQLGGVRASNPFVRPAGKTDGLNTVAGKTDGLNTAASGWWDPLGDTNTQPQSNTGFNSWGLSEQPSPVVNLPVVGTEPTGTGTESILDYGQYQNTDPNPYVGSTGVSGQGVPNVKPLYMGQAPAGTVFDHAWYVKDLARLFSENSWMANEYATFEESGYDNIREYYEKILDDMKRRQARAQYRPGQGLPQGPAITPHLPRPAEPRTQRGMA